MNAQLVCSVKKSIITFYDGEKHIIINNTKAYNPNNVIHLGKKCPPINFYLKNGRYNPEMSDIRKDKLSRLNIPYIKECALNNVITKLSLNLLK